MCHITFQVGSTSKLFNPLTTVTYADLADGHAVALVIGQQHSHFYTGQFGLSATALAHLEVLRWYSSGRNVLSFFLCLCIHTNSQSTRKTTVSTPTHPFTPFLGGTYKNRMIFASEIGQMHLFEPFCECETQGKEEKEGNTERFPSFL